VNTNAPFRRPIACIGEDGNGQVWFAGSAGLTLIESDNEYLNFKRDSGAHYGIRALAGDRAGNLYCAAPNYGLMRREGDQFTTLGKEASSGAENICSMCMDADGALWITTDGAGLYRFKDGAFRQWTKEDGLPDDSPLGVGEDAFGNLWISFGAGIFRCSKAQLESYERGKQPPVLFWQLPVKSGAAASVGNMSRRPQPARLPDGRLCFPSHDRLVLFDPARLASATVQSLPVVDESIVDGVSLRGNSAGELRVKSGARQFEFRFTAPDLAGDGSQRFRYRLEGFDTSWEDAGDQRVAHYKYLHPGHYEFRVMAGGADGRWREAPHGLKSDYCWC